jgi:hypothetical protein
MDSFEQPRYTEIPRLEREEIENISNEILENYELVDYLQTKIQQKLDFKEKVSHDDGTNDFHPWRRLGMFIVHEQRLPEKFISILQRNGVDIYDDEVLELHIPPQNANLEIVGESFARIREYLNANKRERVIPKYIYGVSYLAPLAKRWGFTVVPLPRYIQVTSGAANILQSYADSTDNPKKQKIAKRFATEDISLCYMSVDDLLDREN